MIKSDLRERGYSVVEEFPRESKVNILWAVLTWIFVIGTFSALFFLTQPDVDKKMPDDLLLYMIKSAGRVLTLGFFESEVAGYLVFAVFMLFVYLFMKLFMTILFCRKSESIKMRFLENKGIPICYCREALRVWQTVLIYLVPFVLMYSLYLFLCMHYQGNAGFVVLFFCMMFFLVFDLTLVLYVLAIKIKEKPDYISIDFHIYGYTLYRKTYVKFNNKKRKKAKKAFDTLAAEMSEKNIKNGKFNWKNRNYKEE